MYSSTGGGNTPTYYGRAAPPEVVYKFDLLAKHVLVDVVMHKRFRQFYQQLRESLGDDILEERGSKLTLQLVFSYPSRRASREVIVAENYFNPKPSLLKGILGDVKQTELENA